MKWVITGGCGFVGAALVKHLWQQHRPSIRVVDRLSAGKADALHPVPHRILKALPTANTWPENQVDVFAFDISDAAAAQFVAQEADIIVHLAANTGVQPSIADPMMDCQSNVLGTLAYLEAARASNSKRFIFASSGAPVGAAPAPVHEGVVPRPLSPYGASKLAGEGYCSAYHHSYGLDTVSLRFSNLYGPGSKHKTSVIAKFCDAIFQGETIAINGTGTQTRDFLYVDDAVAAIERAAYTDGIGGELYQLGNGRPTSILEILQLLEQQAKRHGLSMPPVRHSAPLPGEVQSTYALTRKVQQHLNWEPEVDLQTGLERTLQSFIPQTAP